MRTCALALASVLAACASPGRQSEELSLGRVDITPLGSATPGPPAITLEGALVDGLTLDEALALSDANNPRLLAARRAVEVAEGRVVAAGQWPYNPTLGLGVERTTPFSGGEGSFGAQLSQTFQTGGQRDQRRRVAEVEVAQVRASADDAARVLRGDATRAFWELASAEARVGLASRRLEIAAGLGEAADARLAAKQVPEVERNLVRVELERARNELARAETEARASRLRLAALLGSPGRLDLVTAADLSRRARPLERERALGLAREERPDVRVLERAVEAAREGVELEKASRWPDVTFSLAYQRTTESIGGPSDRDHLFGLGIELPLPLFNRRQGEIAAASARVSQLEAERDALLVQVELEVDVQLQALRIAQETIAVYEGEILRLARSNLDGFERAYRAGEVGTLELLRAQEDYNRAAFGRLDAQLEYQRARAGLEAALGARLPEEGP